MKICVSQILYMIHKAISLNICDLFYKQGCTPYDMACSDDKTEIFCVMRATVDPYATDKDVSLILKHMWSNLQFLLNVRDATSRMEKWVETTLSLNNRDSILSFKLTILSQPPYATLLVQMLSLGTLSTNCYNLLTTIL